MRTLFTTTSLVALAAAVEAGSAPAKAPKVLTKKEAAKAARAAKATATVEAAKVDAPAVDATNVPEGEQPKVRRSIVPGKFKDKYKAHGGSCGDDMALELKAATTTRNADKREVLDIPALKVIAAANGLDGVLDGYIAKALNNGQLRMNIGNRLRGLLKAGTDVTIGKRLFKAEDMAT